MAQEGENKLIGIEGIIRGGSDLDCVDGACNEIIGLEHENGYMRPYTPKDLGITLTGFVRLFVHKTDTQTNYILIDTNNSLSWVNEADVEENKDNPNWIANNKREIDLNVPDSNVQMVALGNIVAIDCVNAILFTKGDYTLSVRGGYVDFSAKVGLKKNGFLLHHSNDKSEDNNKFVNIARFNAVSDSKNIALAKGSIVGLCYIRYGLKLYDGTYINLSDPVLVGDADYAEVRENYNRLNTVEKKGGAPMYFDDWLVSVRERFMGRNYNPNNDALGKRWGLAEGDYGDNITDASRKYYGLYGVRDGDITQDFFEQKIQFRSSLGYENVRDYPSMASTTEACVVEDIDDGGIGWDSIFKAFNYYSPVRRRFRDLWDRRVSGNFLSENSYQLPVYAASTCSADSDGQYNSFAMRLMNCPFIKIYKAIPENLENFIVSLDIMITYPVDYIESVDVTTGNYDNNYHRLPELRAERDVRTDLQKNMDMFYVLESIPFGQLKNMKENKSGSVYSIGVKKSITTITRDEGVEFTQSNSSALTKYGASYLYNNRLHIADISTSQKTGLSGGFNEIGIRNFLNNYLHFVYPTYSRYWRSKLATESVDDHDERNPYRFMEICKDNVPGNGSKDNGDIYWDSADCKNNIGSMSGVVSVGGPFSLGDIDNIVKEKYSEGGNLLYKWIKNGKKNENDSLTENKPFMIKDTGMKPNNSFYQHIDAWREYNHIYCRHARATNSGKVADIKRQFGFAQDDLVSDELLAIVRFDINQSEGTSAARNIKSQYDVISLSVFNDNIFRSYISPIAGLESMTIESICMIGLREQIDGAMSKGYEIGDVSKIDVNKEFTMTQNTNDDSNHIRFFINGGFKYVTLSGLIGDKIGEVTNLGDFLSVVFDSSDSLSVSGNTFEVSEVNSLTKFDEVNTYTAGRGTIIGFASNANDVSTGQFGQFPLYVFTTEGIFAFNINTTGDVAYGSSVPVSRDVCNNKNSICETSKIVLFSTDRGLMLLHGSDVECISVTINGRPDKFLPHPVADEAGDGLNVYHRATSHERLVDGQDYLSRGEYADFKDFISNNDTHLAYMYEKDKVVAYNKDFEYVYMIDVVDYKSCYVTKIPSQISNHTDNYPDTMVMIKQDAVRVSTGMKQGWIEYDTPIVEIEDAVYSDSDVDSYLFGKTETDNIESQDSYAETQEISLSKEIECSVSEPADISARSGETSEFKINLKIESAPLASAMYYGEDSDQWQRGEGITEIDKEASVNVRESIGGTLNLVVTRTPKDGGETEVVLQETELINESKERTVKINSWEWSGIAEPITLNDNAAEETHNTSKRFSVLRIDNNCVNNNGSVIINPVDFSQHPELTDATIKVLVAGSNTTIVYDSSQVNHQEITLPDGGYAVFADINASGEWDLVESYNPVGDDVLSIDRAYSFNFSIDKDYTYNIEVNGLTYEMESGYTKTSPISESGVEVKSSLFGSLLGVKLECSMDYETELKIEGEYGEYEAFEEVEPIKLSKFTYDGEDVPQKVILQTRPIKVSNDLMKQAFRVVARGDIMVSDEKVNGENKRVGLYVMASNDTKKWMYIGGTEHEYNGYPMTDIGTTIERFTYKYLMVVLCGELSRDSYIRNIELCKNYKYNKKLR